MFEKSIYRSARLVVVLSVLLVLGGCHLFWGHHGHHGHGGHHGHHGHHRR